ncbi:MAG: pyridoxamine 5'-phosphate oxidase [Flavobacteriaceae bacterium]|nr:pyridoxamine 5'-phosphate oxidase [Flavobacteriaceae bacterium]
MAKNLANIRKSYGKSDLNESILPIDPITLFKKWFHELESSGSTDEPNAMAVATQGEDGFPKNRMVLLKRYSHEGFVFYTNYESEKGKAIAQDPKVCLSFYWPVMERQVIIKGEAEKLATNLSDGYFESRPDASKMGAIASPQSSVIESRAILEDSVKELEKKYVGKEIPRPAYWGGYLVKPVSVEFWQGRPNRLHDRFRYTLEEDLNWKIERLAP